MKKRLLSWFLCLALLLPLVTLTAHADCAPKPSVHVNLLCEDKAIVTLLAQREGNGPHSTIAPGEAPSEWQNYGSGDLLRAWERFRDYQDPDGFHFWGNLGRQGIGWGYYPPEVFKIAVYFPRTDTLIVSAEIYETYAFQSDFRVSIPDQTYTDGQIVSMEVQKDFDYVEAVTGFFVRVLVTLAVEFALAWVMGYREKRFWKVILSVNLVTQVVLNGMLSLWYIFDGPFDALLRLFVAEFVVLVMESVIYARRLKKDGTGAGKAVAYAIAANLLSVYVGWAIIE